MKYKILIVDDDQHILEMLQVSLKVSGFECIIAQSAAGTFDQLQFHVPDLILMDWMMPYFSGLKMVRKLRHTKDFANVPIIMITAKAEEQSIVSGLNAGVDDYIIKPFSIRELVARINALLRRSTATNIVNNGDDNHQEKLQSLDLQTGILGQLRYLDKVIELKPTEFQLMSFLIKNPNKVHPRTKLLGQALQREHVKGERSIDVYIRRLRQKLKPLGLDHCIETLYGFGYSYIPHSENQEKN